MIKWRHTVKLGVRTQEAAQLLVPSQAIHRVVNTSIWTSWFRMSHKSVVTNTWPSFSNGLVKADFLCRKWSLSYNRTSMCMTGTICERSTKRRAITSWIKLVKRVLQVAVGYHITPKAAARTALTKKSSLTIRTTEIATTTKISWNGHSLRVLQSWAHQRRLDLKGAYCWLAMIIGLLISHSKWLMKNIKARKKNIVRLWKSSDTSWT